MKWLWLILLPVFAYGQTVTHDTTKTKRVTVTRTQAVGAAISPLLELAGTSADTANQNYAGRIGLYINAPSNTYNAPYYSGLRVTGYGRGNAFHHTASLSGIRAEAQVDSGSYDTAEGIDAYAINNMPSGVSSSTSLYAGRFQAINNGDTIGHGIGWKVNNASGTGTYGTLFGGYIANQTKGIINIGLQMEGVGNGGRITWAGDNSHNPNSGIKSEYAGILRLDAISVGINSSPDSNITLNLAQPTGLGAQNGAAISLALNDSLYATANSDILYGIYINTKPSVNGKSGVSSYALYSPKADTGYFVGPFYQLSRHIQGLSTLGGLITQQDSILYFDTSPGASVPKKMEIRFRNGSAGITGNLTSTRSTTLFNTSAFTGMGLGNTSNQHLIFATNDTVRMRFSSNDGLGVTLGRVAGTATEQLWATTVNASAQVKPGGNSVEGGPGVSAVNDTVNWTAQTASIGATNFANTATGKLYRVTIYLHTTTAGSAGTVLTTISWNDGAAKTYATATADLTSTTNTGMVQDVVTIYVASGTPTFATTVAGATGSPQYALRMSLERLW